MNAHPRGSRWACADAVVQAFFGVYLPHLGLFPPASEKLPLFYLEASGSFMVCSSRYQKTMQTALIVTGTH